MLHIGTVAIEPPLILAPLAGYSDLPFRLLCRRYGAGLVVSEMISCHGLVYSQKKTIAMLQSAEEEMPLSIQLFGAEPTIMGEAAAILQDFHPALLDINMGCPVKKVTRKGGGAALMKSPALAEKIIRAVVDNSDVPVTVKTRIGVDNAHITGDEFAKMAQDAGAAAITIHGRTWAQAFSGTADWDAIAKVREAVSIPVIGNGDITDFQEAMTRMEQSGCDGVMVGRGALGNPWIFSPQGRPENLWQIATGARDHLELMAEYLPVSRMLGVIKNHIGRYFKDLRGSSKIREIVHRADSFEQICTVIEQISSGWTPESAEQPQSPC